MRLGLLLLAALLLAACRREGGASGPPNTLRRIVERGEMVVGLEVPFPPFEMTTTDGSFEGFDVDLMREYARELGVKLRIQQYSFESLPAALQNGNVDMVWSGVTATVERSQRTLFSDIYFRTRLCLLVHKDSAITGYKDAAGKRLVVKLGTTGETSAASLYPDSKPTKLDDEALCAQEVATGRADAFLYDRFSILRHHAKYADVTRVIDDVPGQEPYAVCFRPGEIDLWRSVNLFFDRVRRDGRYVAIHTKYFGVPPDER